MNGTRNALILSAAAALALSLATGFAQGTGSGSTGPRLPSAIRGLDEGQAGPPSANWLLDAADDMERFRRIQIYAGGTYEQMWQIGYRYEQVYHAIVDENFELGLHHWRKLRDVFNVALMKRPRRTPNAEAMFLRSAWGRLEQALEARDAEVARRVFLDERGVCMACHVAEEMAFLNDTPIFRDTASFPSE
jgi:hypothetical protein